MASKCVLLFVLFLAVISAVANAADSSPLVDICSKVLGHDQMVEFCANDFLKGKEADFANNDWEKMSRAAISQGVARVTALQETVANMAQNKSLPLYERAIASICLDSVKKGTDMLSKAAAEFETLTSKPFEDELRKVQIKVDNGKFNQGKCDELLEGQVSFSSLKQQVHNAYVGCGIVSKFLFYVRA